MDKTGKKIARRVIATITDRGLVCLLVKLTLSHLSMWLGKGTPHDAWMVAFQGRRRQKSRGPNW